MKLGAKYFTTMGRSTLYSLVFCANYAYDSVADSGDHGNEPFGSIRAGNFLTNYELANQLRGFDSFLGSPQSSNYLRIPKIYEN
jgi:hypothetical protein